MISEGHPEVADDQSGRWISLPRRVHMPRTVDGRHHMVCNQARCLPSLNQESHAMDGSTSPHNKSTTASVAEHNLATFAAHEQARDALQSQLWRVLFLRRFWPLSSLSCRCGQFDAVGHQACASARVLGRGDTEARVSNMDTFASWRVRLCDKVCARPCPAQGQVPRFSFFSPQCVSSLGVFLVESWRCVKAVGHPTSSRKGRSRQVAWGGSVTNCWERLTWKRRQT